MIRIDAAKRAYLCTWWISGPMVWGLAPRRPPRCELRGALTEAHIRRALADLANYRD